METLNKYWKVSGWKIFDILDRKAHEVAVEKIGECVTANGSINYYSQLEENEAYYLDLNYTEINENKIEVYIWIKTDRLIATATFLFIRLK